MIMVNVAYVTATANLRGRPRSKQALFLDKMKKELQVALGRDCRKCGHRRQLEFAHVKKTKLSGKTGRGKKKRLYDIKNNFGSYILLCKPCHREFDRLHKFEHPVHLSRKYKSWKDDHDDY